MEYKGMKEDERLISVTPSKRQIAYQNMEYFCFIHFTVNTFTGSEWGLGDEPESIFNPEELDARQWAKTAAEGGMKGLILTCKYHDGFCLWPSKYTEHSMKNSPYKNGKGDIVRETAEACKEYGLKFGVYEGDFAIVFPNVIHHYQVFGERENKVVFLHIDPAVLSGYLKELQTYSPENPVLKKKNMHPDVVHAINFLTKNPECNSILAQAYAQIIIAYVFTDMPMIDKKLLGSDDLIYNSVEYIAKNFRNEISLEKMALDLGVGKYVLSRMFAKTFHCNFNKYVNGVRLNYAVAALENTQDTITNICFDCGFESQRTFNRVFKERYKISPSDYRNTFVKDMLL